MRKSIPKRTLNRSLDIFKLISKVRDEKKRNLLRGYSSKVNLYVDDIEKIRKENSTHDSAIVGALLKGDYGLRHRPGKENRRTSSDIFKLTSFEPIAEKGMIKRRGELKF